VSTATPLYRACIEDAARQGRLVLLRAIAAVEQSLDQRARRAPDATQRAAVHDAIGLLHRHGPMLAERYSEALLLRFTLPSAAPSSRGGGSLKFTELELVDDRQLQESVEVARAEQVVAAAAEADLVQLNALVCAARGLSTVRADRNPLVPGAFVRCLHEVVQGMHVPPEVRVRWMEYLGEALGPELAQLYRSLAANLRVQGVSEASFNIAAAPDVPAHRRAAVASAAPTLLTVEALQRLLAGELDPPSAPAAPARSSRAADTDFAATVPAAMEVLQEIRQFDAVLKRLREREVQAGGGGSAAYREAVRREAHRPGQAIALEVVSLMVENIAGDPRLLEPVARAVRQLEPALLRLALADPRFFSNRRHPARRLLDEMTTRSLAWTAVDDAGFETFLTPLVEAVDALVETNVAGPEPFAFALEALDEAWSRGLSRERRRREKAVRALMRAEQRNLLAERISREIGERPDVAGAPGEVAAFLRGPWAQVIAQAQLAADGDSEEGDAGALRTVIPELLWSVQPHTTPAAVARLGRRLPALLEALRGGMLSIGYTEGQVRRFFDRLQELQQSAIRGIAAEAMPPVVASDRLESLIGPALPLDGAWLAPAEAQESGFLDALPGKQPLFESTQPSLAGAQPGEDREDGEEGGALVLRKGSWVELLLDGTWSRWQLAWTSPHATLWMFTGPGGRTHSMRPALAEAMLRAGTLRVVSGDRLLDEALDAVAEAALQNSTEVRL
jgi:hypothetical protein